VTAPRIRHIGARQAGAEPPAFADICTDASCQTCALWQRPAESRSAWLARLGALHRSDMVEDDASNRRSA